MALQAGDAGKTRSRHTESADEFHEIIGRSAAIQQIKQRVSTVARNHCTVLITGESGVGKELIARAIHRLSDRSESAFVATNCGALPESLLESQLFGHRKGAFTGATQSTLGLFRAANEGTVFLDEVTEMSPALQVKLLRVLQEREVTPVGGTESYPVDVRIIAASNRPANELLDGNVLRHDLYYRLTIVHLELPPLRTRRDDVDELLRHFIHLHALNYGRSPIRLADGAVQLLRAYDWPGNVRELSNTIERMYALGLGPMVTAGEIAPHLRWAGAPGENPVHTEQAPFPSWEEAEKRLLKKALDFTKGGKAAAAKLLKIDRHRLARKIKKYNLDV